VTGDSLSVEPSVRADWIVVRLEGGIDLANARDVETRLLDAAGDNSVALELSDLDYLDSAGLAMIDRIARALAGRGRALELIAAEGGVAHAVLAIARLAGVPVLTEEAVESA
jgi:anti-anti-sigma factor